LFFPYIAHEIAWFRNLKGRYYLAEITGPCVDVGARMRELVFGKRHIDIAFPKLGTQIDMYSDFE
jgi:hypothetical protein